MPFDVLVGVTYENAVGHSVTTEACTSPHFTCRGLCGMEVWKFIGAICAMLMTTQQCLNLLMVPSGRSGVTGYNGLTY